MAELKLEHIDKSFGSVRTIKDVNLDITDGELIVFVGPSGCGKSTLLRMVAGLETITSGKLMIGGKDMGEVDAAERRCAMVFQNYALYPHMTVRENLGFAMRMKRVSKEQVEAKVLPVAKMLRLDDLLDRKPAQLSGGQRQRVAIGRALVRSPQVFLFDEPLSNLDAELRVQMRVEIAQLHEQLGITTIYVTHDQVEAMTLADRMVVLREGRIEQVGSPLDLYDQPANTFVAGFIGSPAMNMLKGKVIATENSFVRVALDLDPSLEVAVKATAEQGDAVTLGIRPEHIVLGEVEGEATYKGQATHVELLGGDSFIHVRGEDRAIVIRDSMGRRAHSGDDVIMSFPSAVCHLFNAEGTRISKASVRGDIPAVGSAPIPGRQ